MLNLPTTQRRLVITTAVVLNVLLLLRLGAVAVGRVRSISEDPLPSAYRLSTESQQVLAKSFGTGWKALFLAFASGEKPESLHHLGSLIATRGAGQLAVGYVRGAVPPGNALLPFPRLHDNDLLLHRELHIPDTHGHGGLVVITNGFEIDFRSVRMPGQDAVRQLVEKYVRPEIDYLPADVGIDSLFGRGQKLPEIAVRHIISGAQSDLRSAAKGAQFLVVFGAPCSSCQLNGYLEELRGFRASSPDARVIVLMADEFEASLVSQLYLQGSLPPDTFAFSRQKVVPAELSDATRFRREGLRPTVVIVTKSDLIGGTTALRYSAAR